MNALRDYLLLSRPWYLPTVWSNCLAGWWLAGGNNASSLPLILGGASCLFLAGSFSKDALDGRFDSQNRLWRPIPAGRISTTAAYAWALYWAALGTGLLFCVRQLPGLSALGFVVCAFAYNASHLMFAVSPVLLGSCRFFLYLVSAAAAAPEITGWAIWGGVAVATYTAGARWLIPEGAAPLRQRYWPLIFLFFPVLLAVVMNAGEYREAGLLLSLVLVLWCLRSLRHIWWSPQPDPSTTYSGLVAGTVFVDWLAVADGPKWLSSIFICLFIAGLLLQRAQPGISGKSR